MGVITKPFHFTSGTTIEPSQVNSDFDTLYSEINGNLSSANVASDIVTTSGVQTLSNKTLNVNRSIGQYDNWVDESDAATITFNLASGNKQRVTLAGNRTLALSNVQNGHVFLIDLIQDTNGNRTVTWFSTITWFTTAGTAPTLSAGASKHNILMFIQTATNTYLGFVLGLQS
jgi:hypothetical protein